MNRKQRNRRKLAERRGLPSRRDFTASQVNVRGHGRTTYATLDLLAHIYREMARNIPDHRPPIRVVSYREWKALHQEPMSLSAQINAAVNQACFGIGGVQSVIFETERP